jgi:predicted acetyltransferase
VAILPELIVNKWIEKEIWQNKWTVKTVITELIQNSPRDDNLKRIDGHYIIHEIEHVLHFERGNLYTVRELITKPGTKH